MYWHEIVFFTYFYFFIGPFVRLAPNHLSIADPDALIPIYGHGNGALKSEFYDAFVSITRGVFSTRDRVEHSRKRKIISHIFSQKSVGEFEPHIRLHVSNLVQQWDRLFGMAVKGMSGTDGEGGWRGEGGRLWLDCLPCKAIYFLKTEDRRENVNENGHRGQLSRL